MNQSVFKFPEKPNYSIENFIVSDSNKEAFDYITNFPWPEYAINIYGSKSSGKTHLSHIASSQVNIIEDVSKKHDEEELFHKLNSVKENSEYILLTSEMPVSEMDFKLADLKSRLKAIPNIEISQPDDKLTYMLFARQFEGKQLKVSDDVINFLTTRLDRKFEVIYEAVNRIDKLSLQQKRNITIPLIKQIFDE